MQPLLGKKIILGVSASIACYKSLTLCRLLIKQGAEVRVVLTPDVHQFVAPLTFAVLSKHNVSVSMFDNNQWNNHVELGLWADCMLVAPATANTLAKMANGLCDNLLLAVYLSARCPVYVAPAMDEDMWAHASTQANCEKIIKNRCEIIPVAHGELASGLVGEGRMAEPEAIIQWLINKTTNQPLKNKKVLINAGPTYEAIDPVRFIGNHSSGKMGVALAKAAIALGAEVHLVIGPNHLTMPQGCVVTQITSSDDMYDACVKKFENTDIAICAAAVADYKPATVSANKIKKGELNMAIELVKTKDTLAKLGSLKTEKQLLVGFALETNNEIEYGKSKLKNKNLDAIVINKPSDAGTGFGYDTNAATWVDSNNHIETWELQSKEKLAFAIWTNIIKLQDN
jgi:phosphopantothenoylcysteine decarboxylase/phosphopantothenate--cysteine ligase